MAHLIVLPLTAFRKPTLVRDEPAVIEPIEGKYFEAARIMRARANRAATMGRVDQARELRSRSQQLDGIAYAIKAKADALARAEARNAVWNQQQGGMA